MAGFFGFGGKTKYVDEPNQPAQSNEGAFFLNPDDAKSFGNIEFMRKTHTIKRTFPKIKNGLGAKVIAEISSIKKALANSNGVAPQVTPMPESTPQKTQTNSVRRSADKNMDMFRKMARDMKK